MNKKDESIAEVVETKPVETPKAKQPRKKKYIIPDIDGGGPSVTIDATSIEEAIQLFRKGQA